MKIGTTEILIGLGLLYLLTKKSPNTGKQSNFIPGEIPGRTGGPRTPNIYGYVNPGQYDQRLYQITPGGVGVAGIYTPIGQPPRQFWQTLTGQPPRQYWTPPAVAGGIMPYTGTAVLDVPRWVSAPDYPFHVELKERQRLSSDNRYFEPGKYAVAAPVNMVY